MRGEEGMTIVEVVVAGLILVLGALGVLGIVDAASRNTFRAEQSQVVANVLQGEMEKLRQTPYAELALEQLPAHVSDPNHPNSRITSVNHFRTGRDGTGTKQLVYNGSSNGSESIEEGTVPHLPTPFEVGNVSGTIHRFIVWDTCPSALCADGRYLKRAIVSVKLDPTASGGQNRRYQEIQSQFVDPEAKPSVFPGQKPGGSDTTSWTLWLTDTPCNADDRLPVEASHATHNTRGDCEDGVREENVPGAPDLLWPEAPPEEEDDKYDYATDIEPQPDADEGLQLLPGAACAEMTDLARGVATEPDAEPTGDPDAYRKVHRWLSPPMPGEPGSGDVLLTGTGTLSLWSRSISGAVYPGRVCAWLFVRSYDEIEATITDTLAINLGPPQSLHFEHFATAWPSSGWTEVALPLSFGYAGEGGALPLPPGSRLGLAISVGGDTPTGLQLLYDQPSFDSRLQLATTGALPPGFEPEEPEEP